ncbi:hypothetical protein JCM3774_002802 [Rhodotorula dairenensis]
MHPDEPTHFNVLVAGTGVQESILAAALSKAGYSVLQLDTAPYYGTEHASLSLTELHDWVTTTAATEADSGASTSSRAVPDDLERVSQRFSISLEPVLLCAQGPGLDLLVRSRVASYLQFGLVGGVGLFTPTRTATPVATTDASSPIATESSRRGRVKRVPASKSDVFTDQTLSLVEKRRLTKLLLFAAGQDPLVDDPILQAEPDFAFVDYLRKGYSLSGTIADSLAYALALCTFPSDRALPALERIRSIIHAVGRYGPSPFLVGHYGGAGDLVGGFSRICAVWGGGQILGRPILPLDLEPEVGRSVPPSQPPFSTPETPPPPPAQAVPGAEATRSSSRGDAETTPRPLGIPVRLVDDAAPTVFTGDWVVSSPHLLPTLFPSRPLPDNVVDHPRTAHLVAILRAPIPFPPRTSASLEEPSVTADDEPDSELFVFPPAACHPDMASVTALQTGKGTMSCPDGYHVLYFSGSLLCSSEGAQDARSVLEPYLEALLALESSTSASAADCPEPTPTQSQTPLYSAAYWSPSPVDLTKASCAPPSASETIGPLPLNLLITPSLPSAGQTSSLIETLDQVVPSVEQVFWQIVGEEGRQEGVQFFPREERIGDEE